VVIGGERAARAEAEAGGQVTVGGGRALTTESGHKLVAARRVTFRMGDVHQTGGVREGKKLLV
jgi:hypothetical protein